MMAGQCGEVVTLQLGHYASYVGTHLWNLQVAEKRNQDVEICRDVLFRQGVTLRGQETYTPRLIVLDLKGSLNSLREEGLLYENVETENTTPAWKGKLTTYEEEPVRKTPLPEGFSKEEGEHATEDFHVSNVGDPIKGRALPGGTRKRQRLEESVSVWSDFLHTNLHPKSVCIASRYYHGGGVQGLESFSQGEALLSEPSYLEEMEDRLHFFTEECDYLQGFQIICDLHSGFSGVGSKMAELLHDDYPGRGIVSWGTCPVAPVERDLHKDMYQLLNCILGIVQLSSHSSLFCPLTLKSSLGRRPRPPVSFTHLLYDAELQYHSSAVLAITLDALTTPYRMSSSHMSMTHFADALTFGGRKVASAFSSLPFPLESSSCLPDALLPFTSSAPWACVSACGEEGVEPGGKMSFSQSVVFRGMCKEKQTSPLPRGTRPRSALHACSTGEDVLQTYTQTVCPSAASVYSLLQHPCTLGPSFPQFFSPHITKDGFTVMEVPAQPAPAVDSIPVLVALQTSPALHRSLRSLYQEVKKVDVRRWGSFFAAGVEHDDLQETVHQLLTLAQYYKSRQGSETDEDSD